MVGIAVCLFDFVVPAIYFFIFLAESILLFIYLFFKFYFIFKLYIIVLVLPNIKMNPSQVYMFLLFKRLSSLRWKEAKCLSIEKGLNKL